MARIDALVSGVSERIFGDVHDIVFSSNAWDVERAHELNVDVNTVEYTENATFVLLSRLTVESITCTITRIWRATLLLVVE